MGLTDRADGPDGLAGGWLLRRKEELLEGFDRGDVAQASEGVCRRRQDRAVLLARRLEDREELRRGGLVFELAERKDELADQPAALESFAPSRQRVRIEQCAERGQCLLGVHGDERADDRGLVEADAARLAAEEPDEVRDDASVVQRGEHVDRAGVARERACEQRRGDAAITELRQGEQRLFALVERREGLGVGRQLVEPRHDPAGRIERPVSGGFDLALGRPEGADRELAPPSELAGAWPPLVVEGREEELGHFAHDRVGRGNMRREPLREVVSVFAEERFDHVAERERDGPIFALLASRAGHRVGDHQRLVERLHGERSHRGPELGVRPGEHGRKRARALEERSHVLFLGEPERGWLRILAGCEQAADDRELCRAAAEQPGGHAANVDRRDHASCRFVREEVDDDLADATLSDRHCAREQRGEASESCIPASRRREERREPRERWLRDEVGDRPAVDRAHEAGEIVRERDAEIHGARLLSLRLRVMNHTRTRKESHEAAIEKPLRRRGRTKHPSRRHEAKEDSREVALGQAPGARARWSTRRAPAEPFPLSDTALLRRRTPFVTTRNERAVSALHL